MKIMQVVPFEFDAKAWSEALNRVDHITREVAREMSGLTKAGWAHWLKGAKTSSYVHPGMLNFINVCNLLDLDPRQFFVLNECDHAETGRSGWIATDDIVNDEIRCKKCHAIIYKAWHYNDGGSTPGRDNDIHIMIDRRDAK